MIDKVLDAIKVHSLLRFGDTVTVGVSGGADSVCLLGVLCALQKTLGITVLVCHVHHGLRETEADEDMRFVQALCKTYRVPCYVHYADVRQKAKEEHISEEAAGRAVRYAFFRSVAQGGAIAVAHHQNDRAETLLLNLIRGGGGGGLSSLRYRNGDIIRPLLGVTREEIEAYLKEQGIAWREDSTNADTAYRRNTVRHRLLPLLKELNPNIVETLNRTADFLRADDDYLTEEAKKRLDTDRIATALTASPPPIAARMALLLWRKHGEYDLTAHDVDGLLSLAAGASGKRFTVGSTVAEKNYDTIVFYQKETEDETFSYLWDMKEDLMLPSIHKKLCIEGSVAFDREKLGNCVTVRTRLSGDRFAPEGMDGHKSVKEFLIDEKIPRHKRDKIPLLIAENGEIAWVIPYRRSRDFVPSDDTKKTLSLTLKEQE